MDGLFLNRLFNEILRYTVILENISIDEEEFVLNKYLFLKADEMYTEIAPMLFKKYLNKEGEATQEEATLLLLEELLPVVEIAYGNWNILAQPDKEKILSVFEDIRYIYKEYNKRTKYADKEI